MNAAAKEMRQGSIFQGSLRSISLTQEALGLSMLVVIMLLSAISVIYLKNYERNLFSQYEFSQRDAQRIHVEWGQLLSEESTWVAPARVQVLARSYFGMQLPQPTNVFTVRL